MITQKIIAGVLLLIGISFMIVTKLSNLLVGNGFIFGVVTAFWGGYILIETNKFK